MGRVLCVVEIQREGRTQRTLYCRELVMVALVGILVVVGSLKCHPLLSFHY
jgi:hypothetical protein